MRRPAKTVSYIAAIVGLSMLGFAAKADPTAVAPASDTPTLNLYDNYDPSGEPYRTIKNSAASSCADECKSDHECRSLSFDKTKRLCVLSSKPGTLRFDPSIVGGLRSDVTMPAEADNAFEMSCTPKTIVEGANLSRTAAQTLNACAEACEKAADCVAFNFGKTCTMLKTFDSSSASLASLSGIKRQRPAGDAGQTCADLASALDDDVKKPMDSASVDRKNLIVVHQTCVLDNFVDIVKRTKNPTTDPRTLALQKCDPELEKLKALIYKQTGNKGLADRTALTIQRASLRGLEVALLNFFNERKN